jgi:hypothetical protein
MPAKGARTAASSSALRAMRSCASADLTDAALASKVLSEVSKAFCEMNFCRSSRRLFSRFFCAIISFALASSSAAACASIRDCASMVSICAISCPWETGSPSRTSTRFMSPETLISPWCHQATSSETRSSA